MVHTKTKIGLAGCGALGRIVADSLLSSAHPLSKYYELVGIADIVPPPYDVPHLDFYTLAKQSDIVIECLPAAAVGALLPVVKEHGKDLILISAAALLIDPALEDMARTGAGRVIIPAGALAGIDAVTALAAHDVSNITSAMITTTKPPAGLKTAPYVIEKGLDLSSLTKPEIIFEGNARAAAAAFPANVNVAATLSLAGIGAERTMVRVCADPSVSTNSHRVEVTARTAKIVTEIENIPDPSNPKSSIQAAYSILGTLLKMKEALVVV